MEKAEVEKKQDLLNEKIMNLFDNVIEERVEHYKKNKEEITISNVENIISRYSYMNAGIAGVASLVPGPWGMLAVIPEVIAISRNQLAMIYDIGKAHGKEKFMNKDLMIGIFLGGVGANAIGLAMMHGSKLVVKRASLRVMQKLAIIAGGKITQSAAKSAFAKWLPLIGSAALAYWAKFSTDKLGEYAVNMLNKEIEISDEELQDDFDDVVIVETSTNPLDELKMQSMVNLLLADNEIHEKELAYLKTILENIDLSKESKENILNAIKTKSSFKVDYKSFKEDSSTEIAFFADMVALAKRDGKLHPNEKKLLQSISNELELPENVIDDLLIANIQKVGKIIFDTNNAVDSDSGDHLIVNDLITGKDYGIVRDPKTGKYDYYRKG
jgi:uncharacterized protein (DUF697 family)/uncharacterized tellurite resistance protein B-like protein